MPQGRGYVQHPIASCVLYLSPCGLGGPTLMTDQTLLGADDDDAGGGGGLAKRGWFSHARVNRVCVFKADYLHGVVPGTSLFLVVGCWVGRGRLWMGFVFWVGVVS